MRPALIVLVVAMLGSIASAGPAEKLDEARENRRRGEWESAKQTVLSLLNPSSQLASRADLVDAHVILGVCYCHMGERDDAKKEFETALSLDPDKTLDSMLYETCEIRLFDETRAEIHDRLEREKERRKLAEQAEAIRKYLEAQRLYEIHPFYINFLPFGAGQFQNHDTTKAYLFAGGQLAMLGASLGIWLYLTRQYGLVGSVPLDDALRVRRLQQIEIGTGAAFWALYVGSVIDAYRNYKPRIQLKADDSLLPPELKNAIKKPPQKSSWRLIPMPVPSGAGVALSWETN